MPPFLRQFIQGLSYEQNHALRDYFGNTDVPYDLIRELDTHCPRCKCDCCDEYFDSQPIDLNSGDGYDVFHLCSDACVKAMKENCQ